MDSKPKGENCLEDTLQAMLMDALNDWKKRIPELEFPLRWIYAVPNGGGRSKRQAVILKATGTRPGIPDLCNPLPTEVGHSFYIELKVKNNKPSKEQLEFRDYCLEVGNFWCWENTLAGAEYAILHWCCLWLADNKGIHLQVRTTEKMWRVGETGKWHNVIVENIENFKSKD